MNRMQPYGLFYLKLGLLAFFGTWFALACSSNVIDLLNTLHLTSQWAFHSGNYAALQQVLQIYHTPEFVLKGLFYSDILVQCLSTLCFFIAAWKWWQQTSPWPWINLAFGLSIALWATFLVFEEVFIAYASAATHTRLMILELIGLLVVHQLPD